VAPISCIIAYAKFGVYEAASRRLAYLLNASITVQHIRHQVSNCHAVSWTCFLANNNSFLDKFETVGESFELFHIYRQSEGENRTVPTTWQVFRRDKYSSDIPVMGTRL
jgi:hypothetical protein